MRSPSLNRGPRSGKFRVGSKGFHLQTVSGDAELERQNGPPKVVEMIRVRAAEESFEPKCLRGGTILQGRIEEIAESA